MSHEGVPDDLRAAFEVGAEDFAMRLRAAVQARRDVRGGHHSWGEFCEQAGEFGLAFTEYQLALRDDEGDVRALARLVELSEERGEIERAAGYARRLAALRPGDEAAISTLVRLLIAAEAFEEARAVVERAAADGATRELVERLERELDAARSDSASGDEEEHPSELAPGLVPTDADVVRFAHLFAGREDVYARQWWSERGEGGYSPVREPFTPKVARNHLLGGITVGVYPVRLDETATFCAFDIDLTKRAIARARGNVQEARRLKALVAETSRRLAAKLHEHGLAPLIEESGYKGRHLWLFFARPEPARVVHQFGTLVLHTFELPGPDVHVEFFPKQAGTSGGLGNLIKLPLGIHRRTGRRSRLLTASGEPEPDPFAALRRQPKVSREHLHAAIARLKAQPAVAAARAGGQNTSGEGEEHEGGRVTAPAPPAGAPAWTAADFETHAEISHLLRHCPVLDSLKTRVETHRRLTHDEQVVLLHTLGHSAAGVLAVNYLLDLCVDAPPTARLQTPLSGNPISCPKIRKRIPHVTGSVDCNCVFPLAGDHYPTPRLHLRTLGDRPAEPPKVRSVVWDPVERARALGVLWVRRERLAQEIAQLERELVEYMKRERVAAVDTGDGALRLVIEEGAPPSLVWSPRGAEAGVSEGRPAAAVPGTPGEGASAGAPDDARPSDDGDREPAADTRTGR